MDLDVITIAELIWFVKVHQPGATLRNLSGLDVKVGNYFPPKGGPEIEKSLERLLADMNTISSYHAHIAYEKLHPFTDCNGRSGRMLWAWQERDISLGFLHAFYYQTLAHSRR